MLVEQNDVRIQVRGCLRYRIDKMKVRADDPDGGVWRKR